MQPQLKSDQKTQFRELPPALLEEWMREFYFDTEIDLGSSGVSSFSIRELRELLGFTQRDLDQIVMEDSRTLGDPSLREAFARRWRNGNAEEVMATHGSSEAISLIMNSLLRPGDEVVALSPAYQQLFSIAESIGCSVKHWPLIFEQQLVPDLATARKLIGPRTRMVVVNFPHNPTGVSMSLQAQEELIDVVSKTGAYLVWDAAFAEMMHEAPALPDPGLRYDRTISIGTLSKGYGLPGLRVGWCLAAADILERFVRQRDYTTLHLSPLVEFIATRVIENADIVLENRLRDARVNLEILTGWIDRNREVVEWVRPHGGVCAFPRLNRVSDDEAFCRQLAVTQRVLLVPGSRFGCPQHVRLGFGATTSEFEAGLARLSAHLEAVSK